MIPNFSVSSHGWKSRHHRLLPPNFLKNLLLIFLILVVCGSIGVLALFAFVSRDLPDPNALTKRTVKQSTKIYDRTGTHLLYEIFGNENRTLVKVQEGFCKDDPSLPTDTNGIPLFAIKATLAAEDRSFCTHYGFDVKGLLRAFVFGGSRGGGSTLTQQLVKNAILSNEKTLTRKVKELILSVELERRYSKDEILQIYFNEIPYGSTYYGIEAASVNFFGKSAKDLTLAEAATLAAIPQLPTYYINNPDKLRVRRDWILDGMADLGFIKKEEAAAAKATSTPVKAKVSHNIDAPHFVFYVQDLLEQTYGKQAVEEGGLNVITSLDFDLQKKAEQAIKEGVEARSKAYKFNNAALVALDPKTAQVLAMVGSKDYFDDTINGQVNVTTRPRQPGSSFKPIMYTKGFATGYTPNTILWDVKTTFPTPTGPYNPNDYDLKERGPLTVRNALQGSLNLPAIEMTYLIGVDNLIDFANQLGYTTFGNRSRFGLSLGIGGGDVKLLEHTNAFATIDNDGVRHDIAPILKVTDANNVILQEWQLSDGQAVIDPNIAHTTSNILSDNAARTYIFGANSPLTLGDAIPAAAKSGTTNNNVDAWTMGYVPSLTAGVWVGNTDNSQMSNKADGSVVAAPIWNAFMKAALAGKPIDQFPSPTITSTGKPVLDGQMPGQRITIDRASGKLATQYTPTTFQTQKIYAEYHSILQYVDRADPLGPPPANPQSDLYYQPWEDAVKDWIVREEAATGITLTNDLPPTQYDDVHVPANFPSIAFNLPSPDSTIGGRTIDAEVNASAPRGISRVEFYIDGQLLGTDTQVPFTIHVRAPSSIGRGIHTIKAVGYDDIDNSGSSTVNVTIEEDAVGGVLSISDPKQDQTIIRDVSTYNVALSLDVPKQFLAVNVYAEQAGKTERQLIGTKMTPDSPFIQIPWTLPGEGDWTIFASANPKTGGDPTQTGGVLVHVRPGSIPIPSMSGGSPLSPFPPLVPPPVPKTP